MIRRVYQDDFINEFRNMGRDGNFTIRGLEALFEYLEDYEDSTGEQVELDVIVLCCEYTEYADLDDFQNDYGDEYESIEDIEYNTQVIMLSDDRGFIIQDF